MRSRFLQLFFLTGLVLPLQAHAVQVFNDPEDDRIGLGRGPDATALVAEDLGDAVRLSIELTDPLAAAGMTGLIEIDTDQALQSGRVSRISLLCPRATGLGVNRTVDLFARQGPDVPVRDAADDPVGQAHWQLIDEGFAVTIDKSLIGVETGLIDLVVIIGDGAEASDCVPDGGAVARAEVSLNRVLLSVSSGAGGSSDPDGSFPVASGSEVTITAIPEPDYDFVGWREAGEVIATQAEYTFIATTGRDLVAGFEFRPLTFSIASATGSGMITGRIDGGDAIVIAEVNATTAEAVAGNGPPNVEFPHGLLAIRVDGVSPGGSVDFTVTFPETLPENTQYWKYGPAPDHPTPRWYLHPATIAGDTVSFSITDGGPGDHDLTANGVIVDPGGPGIAVAPVPIPALSRWAVLVLMLLLMVMGHIKLQAGSV